MCWRLKPENAEPTLTACAVCGNAELYRRKDFPQTLGVSILALCCVASTATYFYYQQWWTWSILIASAVFDCLLYLLVNDVTVCYRCNAHYRGFAAQPETPGVRADTFERYRQEQMRRKQLQ